MEIKLIEIAKLVYLEDYEIYVKGNSPTDKTNKISAVTIGESPEVRYRVILMASTWGSWAAWVIKRCTVA
jgi:hypothetical protein